MRAAGLYNGPTDGMMDPDTRAAIARFQVQNGLQRSGNLDQQTAARLMSAQAPSSGTTAPAPAAAAPAANQGATTTPMGAGGNTAAPQQQPINR